MMKYDNGVFVALTILVILLTGTGVMVAHKALLTCNLLLTGLAGVIFGAAAVAVGLITGNAKF